MKRAGYAAVLVFAGCLGQGSGDTARELPGLSGTFIQLWQEHRGWSSQDWDELFGYLRRLRLSELVIQWSVYDGTRFYEPANGGGEGSPGPIGHILDRADASGMKVWIGLAHSSGYWKMIGEKPSLVRVQLRRMRAESLRAADELVPLLSARRSFVGWYVCEEVDGTTWIEAERAGVLTEHLHDLVTGLERRTPGRATSVSGFSNVALSPEGLAAFWAGVLSSTSLSRVFFQDGIGTRKIALTQLPAYLRALESTMKRRGSTLCVTVETFEQQNEESSGSAFRALPCPLERLQSQMVIATVWMVAS